MTSTGRQAVQLRFSEEPEWLHQMPVINGEQLKETLPFEGFIAREEPAVRTCIETRRKDVGPQEYASGNYMPTIHKEPVYGTLPTAEAVFFLKDHYGDSSHPHPKSRFFP
jgi:hypothetical protein